MEEGRLKIIALLSWYDEDPAWLEKCVRSLAQVPVDHLIALDGAYRHFPDAKPQSPAEQANAIVRAANEIGIPGASHVCAGVTEVEKRNRLFRIAEKHARHGDWYMIIDADEHVTDAPPDVHDRLKASPFDVAAVTLDEPGHPQGTIRFDTFPMFFRAIPGLRVDSEHFRYRTPDGRLLWGDAKRDRLEPRQDLTDLRVEHRKEFRHRDRRDAANQYYRTRDALGLENLPADRSLLRDAA